MLISRQENEELYRYIFKNEDVDDMIFRDEEYPTSDK